MSKFTSFKSNLAINVLWIISFIVVSSIFIFFIKISGSGVSRNIVVNSSNNSSSSYYDTLKPIDEIISTSMPYYKYNELTDSINSVRFFKDGHGGFGSSTFSPFGGVMNSKFLMDKDVVHKRHSNYDLAKSPVSYFYIIKGWKMKFEKNSLSGDNTYYVKNGIPYFRKYIFKSIKGSHSNWEMTEKKLNYFYEKDDKTILIPISKNIYTFAKYGSMFMMFVFASVLLVCVLLGLKILYNISRGKVFINENIKMLRQATFITNLTPQLVILISLCHKLFFYKYFDENVVLNIDFYKGQIYFLFVGLAVSILYSVFKRGFNIQQENDLVV